MMAAMAAETAPVADVPAADAVDLDAMMAAMTADMPAAEAPTEAPVEAPVEEIPADLGALTEPVPEEAPAPANPIKCSEPMFEAKMEAPIAIHVASLPPRK
jgi:hypothetical protein